MNLAQNNNILRYSDWDGTKNLKTSYNQVDLVIQKKKIESSILNGLGYIVRLEKKNRNKINKNF